MSYDICSYSYNYYDGMMNVTVYDNTSIYNTAASSLILVDSNKRELEMHMCGDQLLTLSSELIGLYCKHSLLHASTYLRVNTKLI